MSYGKELFESQSLGKCETYQKNQTDKQNPSALQKNGQKFTQVLAMASQHWDPVLTAPLSTFTVCVR